jgi:hypothetical protein
MTTSKTRAKVHDVYVKTGPGVDDFGYIPLGQIKIKDVPIGEFIDEIKSSANKRLDILEKQTLCLKEENERLLKEVKESLKENEELRKRLDSLESVFEKNVREWLTR